MASIWLHDPNLLLRKYRSETGYEVSHRNRAGKMHLCMYPFSTAPFCGLEPERFEMNTQSTRRAMERIESQYFVRSIVRHGNGSRTEPLSYTSKYVGTRIDRYVPALRRSLSSSKSQLHCALLVQSRRQLPQSAIV